MKKLLKKIEETMADAALLEMGVPVVVPVVKQNTVRETLEENLIEVAYAEAADYDQIHKAILREHQRVSGPDHPDGCLICEKEHCFA